MGWCLQARKEDREGGADKARIHQLEESIREVGACMRDKTCDKTVWCAKVTGLTFASAVTSCADVAVNEHVQLHAHVTMMSKKMALFESENTALAAQVWQRCAAFRASGLGLEISFSTQLGLR